MVDRDQMDQFVHCLDWLQECCHAVNKHPGATKSDPLHISPSCAAHSNVMSHCCLGLNPMIQVTEKTGRYWIWSKTGQPSTPSCTRMASIYMPRVSETLLSHTTRIYSSVSQPLSWNAYACRGKSSGARLSGLAWLVLWECAEHCVTNTLAKELFSHRGSTRHCSELTKPKTQMWSFENMTWFRIKTMEYRLYR